MFGGAIYLMFFSPKVNIAMLMPIALVISYYLPKSGPSNTIPLRLCAFTLTLLSCSFPAPIPTKTFFAKSANA